MKTLFALACLLEVLSTPVLGVPHAIPKTQALEERQNDARFRGSTMRVLPLGASSTMGHGSSDGNGYRNDLLTYLSPPAAVTYIGPNHNGNMANNANAGYSGFKIQQIASKAPASTSQRPNVIILHAGLNDLMDNDDIANAPTRLGNLIAQLNSACPDALVVVANLAPNRNPTFESRIQNFNAAIPNVIQQRAAAGYHVMLTDWAGATTPSDLGPDGIHLNDGGYRKVAGAIYNTILQAQNQGFIRNPV